MRDRSGDWGVESAIRGHLCAARLAVDMLHHDLRINRWKSHSLLRKGAGIMNFEKERLRKRESDRYRERYKHTDTHTYLRKMIEADRVEKLPSRRGQKIGVIHGWREREELK